MVEGSHQDLAPHSLPVEPDAAEAGLAAAIALLASLPARELLSQVDRTPGRHLAQLCQDLRAPRSRYWRIVRDLEAGGLIRSVRRVRANLLFPTPLGINALHFVRKAGLDPRPRARRRVREFPSLVIYPRRPGT
jgi:hypothetical protein